jgi:hypothetical protein
MTSSNFGTMSIASSQPTSSRHSSHWTLRVLDHWHWPHEAARKRHRTSLRRPNTPRSVHCHSSLHLQCRMKMQRHAHPWMPQHSTKGCHNESWYQLKHGLQVWAWLSMGSKVVGVRFLPPFSASTRPALLALPPAAVCVCFRCERGRAGRLCPAKSPP